MPCKKYNQMPRYCTDCTHQYNETIPYIGIMHRCLFHLTTEQLVLRLRLLKPSNQIKSFLAVPENCYCLRGLYNLYSLGHPLSLECIDFAFTKQTHKITDYYGRISYTSKLLNICENCGSGSTAEQVQMSPTGTCIIHPLLHHLTWKKTSS